MTIGELEPRTKAVGVVAFRALIVACLVLIVAYVRPVRHGLQVALAALHNWAGPLADRTGHTHHADKPLHTGPMPHGVTSNAVVVGLALVPILIGLWRLTKATRDSQTETKAGRILLVVGASAAGLALVCYGLAHWQPGRPAAAVMLLAIAKLSGSLAQFVGGIGF